MFYSFISNKLSVFVPQKKSTINNNNNIITIIMMIIMIIMIIKISIRVFCVPVSSVSIGCCTDYTVAGKCTVDGKDKKGGQDQGGG